MDRLHRRSHAVIREARDVGCGEQLRVLDATRQLRREILRPREDVEHFAIRPVAYGVDRGRKAVFEAAAHVSFQFLYWLQREPGVGAALARLDHPGRHRPKGAIREELHAADAQHVVAVAGREIAIEPLVQHARRQERAHAQSQLAGVVERVQRLQFAAPDIHRMHAGDAEAVRVRDPESHRVDALVPRQLGRNIADESRRIVAQDARRLAVVADVDRAACGRCGRGGDARGAQRRAVHPDAVAGRVREHDRMLRRDGVQLPPMREARARPVVLIPPGAAHPPAGRRFGDSFSDPPHSLGDARDALQINRLHRESGAEQVCVAIRKSGQHEPPACVEHLRVAWCVRILRASDEDEAPVADDRRVGVRRSGVARPDQRVADDEVRHERSIGAETSPRAVSPRRKREREARTRPPKADAS